MAQLTQRIKEGYEEGGTGRLTQAFVNRVTKFVSLYLYSRKKARLLEWSLTGPVPEVDPPGIGIEIRDLREEEIPCFKDIVRAKKLELFRERLAEGKICLVAWHEGEVAWFGWVAMGPEYEPIFRVMLNLKEDEGYLLDAFTNPKYRGKNLHTYMSARRLERLQRMGARRAFGIAAVENLPSRKAHGKGGCVETREVSCINILGIRFHLWKDLPEKELKSGQP